MLFCISFLKYVTIFNLLEHEYPETFIRRQYCRYKVLYQNNGKINHEEVHLTHVHDIYVFFMKRLAMLSDFAS